jgi:YidC/Oxa1 family membrane protein insertase
MLISANIFQPLIDVFESVLEFFHNHVGASWGLSIVLLTVAVRALLIPLFVKQFHSMQRLQQLQPEMKAIQNKYKDDKERQQQEMMRFYRENKVNPLSSCLPLVAQLPVFVSLFYMLRQSLRIDICPHRQPHLANGMINAAHLRPCGVGHGAGFLFIGDLTNKATGVTLVVLLLAYIGSQMASSLLMASPTMDQTQRRIMLFMPLVFVVIFIRYPAGLLVYWITTNLWTMGQQYVIRRRIGPTQAATVSAAAGGGAGQAAGSGRSSPAAGGVQAVTNGAGEANGKSGSSGGLGALIRSRIKPEEQPVPTPQRSGPPPRSPRKKKKRSGRRR